MNLLNKKALSATLLLLTVLSACAVPVELIKNADLESSREPNQPTGFAPAKNGVVWMNEKDNHFVRITAAPGKLVMWYQSFTIPAGHGKMSLSLRVRYENIKVGDQNWHDGRIMMNFLDAQGSKTSATGGPWKGTSDGWKAFTKTYDIPAGTVKLEFMPCLAWAASGVLDIDDIHITLDGEPAVIAPSLLAAAPVPTFFFGGGSAMPKSAMLKVKGNRLVDQTGKEVWLQGLAIPSMEWSANGEHIQESFVEAIKTWKSNCIRLPLKANFWFGTGKWQGSDPAAAAEKYRALVDSLVGYATSNGCYVVLDLHEYKAPTSKHAAFWKDAAARYANHPGVLFDILNEPHGISWDEWRDGGKLAGEKREDAVDENTEAKDVTDSIGMQALVNVVRETGAKNIIIAGGLDWAYTLTGILEGYALKDASGNGIMYSTHIYPWKGNWQKHVLDAAEKYPIFVGEVGCSDKKMPFEKELKDPYKWAPDMLACIQKNKLNWTAWSFHPSASPCILSNWNYTPTPYWGTFVLDALTGKTFTSDKLR